MTISARVGAAVMLISLFVTACADSAADQRQKIADTRSRVVERIDEIATSVDGAGRGIVFARGEYRLCTVGLSGSGVEYWADMRLAPSAGSPREQLNGVRAVLDDLGWSDLEIETEGPPDGEQTLVLVATEFDGVAGLVRPASGSMPDGTLQLTLYSRCMPDPDEELVGTTEDIPLGLPTDRNRKGDQEHSDPAGYIGTGTRP